jgi:DNA-binding LytR/AlgR family response regulator
MGGGADWQTRMSAFLRSSIVNVARVSELQARLRGDYDLVLKSGERLVLQKAYRERLRTALGEF